MKFEALPFHISDVHARKRTLCDKELSAVLLNQTRKLIDPSHWSSRCSWEATEKTVGKNTIFLASLPPTPLLWFPPGCHLQNILLHLWASGGDPAGGSDGENLQPVQFLHRCLQPAHNVPRPSRMRRRWQRQQLGWIEEGVRDSCTNQHPSLTSHPVQWHLSHAPKIAVTANSLKPKVINPKGGGGERKQHSNSFHGKLFLYGNLKSMNVGLLRLPSFETIRSRTFPDLAEEHKPSRFACTHL